MSSVGSIVEAKFHAAGEAVRARVREAVERLTSELAGRVESNTASVMHGAKYVRCIRSSLRAGQDRIFGYVFTAGHWGYLLRFWERGWGGHEVRVKGFTRRVKSRDTVERSSVPYYKPGVGTAWRTKRTRIAKGTATVKPFTRNVSHHQAPMFRPALESMSGSIRSALIAAIKG